MIVVKFYLEWLVSIAYSYPVELSDDESRNQENGPTRYASNTLIWNVFLNVF
jgi:hypothetical protein